MKSLVSSTFPSSPLSIRSLFSRSRRVLVILLGVSLLAAARLQALPPINRLPQDIQDLIYQPNYRNHIIAVDEHGSALNPKCDVTARDGAGRPSAWRVTYKKWDTEDTVKLGANWKDEGRREFANYLEGREGTLDSARKPISEDGVFTTFERLYRAKAVDRVVIHIHGGLNFIGSAGVKACEITHSILEDRAFPIFIVWNSNLFDTYGEHLFGVREGVADRGFGMLTSPLQLTADVGSALSRFPLAFTKLVRNDYYQLRPESFQRYTQAKARFDSLENACERGEGGIKVSLGDDERTNFKRVEDTTSWAAWFGLRTSTTPLIDTLGASAWFNMIRRTRVMFERESTFVNVNLNSHVCLAEQRELRYLSRQGALRYFFDRAQERLGVPDQGGYPPITLIGHSMGAIVIGEILARFPGIKFENVVFMAAASTVNDFKIKVAPYLQTHPTRFYNLCLNPFNETAEREPWEVPELAPRGSLLVWIDSMFETPIAEDDRTMGRWENAIMATDWLPGNVANRTTIKAFGRDRSLDKAIKDGKITAPYDSTGAHGDRLAEPRHHGDFGQFEAGLQPSYRFWRPYYWTQEPIKTATDKTLHLGPVPADPKPKQAKSKRLSQAPAPQSLLHRILRLSPRAEKKPLQTESPAPKKRGGPEFTPSIWKTGQPAETSLKVEKRAANGKPATLPPRQSDSSPAKVSARGATLPLPLQVVGSKLTSEDRGDHPLLSKPDRHRLGR